MIFKNFNLKIPRPSVGFGLLLLALTQLPLALNESLKIACFATTWADYAVFWNWQDIPLDARVRYCQGGNISPNILNKDTQKSK